MIAARKVRTLRHGTLGLTLLCGLCVLVACGPTAQLRTPPGFAGYQEARPHFKVISADGFRMQARRVENEPKSSVTLWRDSIRVHLKHNGYRILGEGQVAVADGAGSGLSITSVYRHQEQDYVYLVALFVRDSHVFLVEAAGPYDLYVAREKDIEQSLRSFVAK